MKNLELTTPAQKIFAAGMIVAVLALLYFLLPPMIVILTNLWIAVILAIPILWVIFNPMLIWNIAKKISWDITKGFISQDKLGFLDRYVELAYIKKAKIGESVQSVGAIAVTVERSLGSIIERRNSHRDQAIVLEGKMKTETSDSKLKEYTVLLSTLRSKVATDTEIAKNLQPRLEVALSNKENLMQLESLVGAKLEELSYQLKAKKEEYTMLKELAAANGKAKEFLNDQTEDKKIFNEALKQIEDSVSLFTASIDKFGVEIQPMLTQMQLQKDGDEQKGMSLIEEFKKEISAIDFK